MAISFPLRAVWRINNVRKHGAVIQFLISVPKKRLRHAVDRVKMRRRIREAYRLNRHLLPSSLPMTDVVFIYLSDELQPYGQIEAAMKNLLNKIQLQLTPLNSITLDEPYN